MATYTFKWPHAAEEVYVTGTFDNWAKTEKLEKKGSHFEKTVTLPDFSDKIFYKFVVDGNWTTDTTASQEKDASGIDNNVLTPEDVIKAAPATAAILSTVSPESTTAALAKDAPLEKNETKPVETPSDIPGGFPETPANELDKESKLINPIPASEGGGNPITLAPGEKVPEFNVADVNSHVKLDKASYEKADALPGVTTYLPPVTSNMIPESSLPINGAKDATISTVAPGSTTAALAADVPLEEPNVPEVVKESQEKAGVDPEASGLSEEVKEKEQVEQELLNKVSEAPSTSEGTAGKGTEKSENDKTLVESVTAAAAGLGAAALATAAVTKDKVVEQASAATATATEAATQLPDPVKESLPVSVQETINNAAKEDTRQEVSPEVPAEVKESIQEAGKNPEAAANTAAVEEKKAVEAELLKEVKEVKPAAGESEEKAGDKTAPAAAAAPATSAATGTTSEATPEAIKDAATPSKAATTVPAADAAGAASSPSAAKKTPESPATTAEKKKKNRLSSFFNKLKSKTSSKDKA